MIMIYVAAELIEKCLTINNEIYMTKVLVGLPPGAKLFDAHPGPNATVALLFTDPEPGPDRVIEVKLQTTSYEKEEHAPWPN